MKKIITIIGTTLLLAILSTSISFAGKPTGGGGKIAVESANPSSAIQGEEKDIYISGSGFGPGANVRYLVTGTDDDTQIEVLSTEYIDATGELKTRVKVKDSATVIDYDIEVQATSGRKGKGTTLFKVEGNGNGGGGGKPGGEDPPPEVTSCADKSSDFPAFVYTKVNSNKRGSPVGHDFYLSNANGDCSVLIYSSSYKSSIQRVSYRQIGSSGIISWAQNKDENAGRNDTAPVVMLLRFEVSGKEISSPLPLSSSIAHKSSQNSNVGILFTSIAPNGDKVLYDFSTTNIGSLYELDISNCSSNCDSTVVLTLPEGDYTRGLDYNFDGSRIYMVRNIVNFVVAGETESTLSFIESFNNTWSSPRIVLRENLSAYGDGTQFNDPSAGLWNFDGSGYSEVVAIQVSDGTIDVIDTTNCLAVGVSDCLTTGESTILREGIVGINPSMAADGILFSSNINRTSIQEYDLDLDYFVGDIVEGYTCDSTE